MPQNTHLETISAEAERLPEPVHAARNPQVIHEGAAELARTLTWLPNSPSSHTFAERSRVLAHDFKPIFTALELPAPEVPTSDDFHWLYDNGRLLYGELRNAARALTEQADAALYQAKRDGRDRVEVQGRGDRPPAGALALVDESSVA